MLPFKIPDDPTTTTVINAFIKKSFEFKKLFFLLSRGEEISSIIEEDVSNHNRANELMWIHGNCESGNTEIFSSALPTSHHIVFAPLVADLVDLIEESNSSLDNVCTNS